MAAVELASGVISLGTDTRQAGRDVSAFFGQTEREAERSGERTGRNFGGKFGGALSKAIPAIGVAGLVGGLVAVGSAFDDMADAIQVGTGKSGKALDELSESAKNIGKEVPLGFAEIGDAVGQVNAALGTTGKPLEQVTSQLLNLSRMTGTDFKTNITAATRAFGDWSISTDQQSSTLDYLFKTSQATGAEVGSLSEKLVQFGAPLRSMGFDLKTSAALLGTFQKTGVNTELVMGSMRIALGKFAKAGQDAPTTLRAMITEIKNMPDATAAAAKGMEIFGTRAGADMADTIRGGKFEIDALMESIASSENTINSAAADTDDFAESWLKFKNKAMIGIEPVATALFNGLSTGMGWISDKGIPTVEGITNAIVNFGGTQFAVNFLKDAFDGLMVVGEKLFSTLKTMFNIVNENKGVFGTLATALTVIMLPAIISTTTGWIASGVAAANAGIVHAAVWLGMQAAAVRGAAMFVVANAKIVAGWTLSALTATKSAVVMAAAWLIALGPVGLIIGAIGLIVGAFVLLWNKCDWFRNFWKGVWEWIKNAAVNVWEGFLKPLFHQFMEILGWVIEKAFAFKDGFTTALDIVGAAVSAWWNGIVKPVWNALGDAIEWVVSHAVSSFEVFKTALGKVGDFFGSVVEGIKNAWQEVKKAVAAPINFVIETVWNNGLLKAWNKVAEWLPGLKPMDPLSPVAFAAGGGVFGGTPGKDSVPAVLMPGEHVLTTADVKEFGGQSAIYALRNMIKLGIPFSWDAARGLSRAPEGVASAIATAPRGGDGLAGLLRAIGVPGYDHGGPVSGSGSEKDLFTKRLKQPGNFYEGHKIKPGRVEFNKLPMRLGPDGKLYPDFWGKGYAEGGAVRPAWEYQLEAGHEFAQSRDGNPYTWGFEDCSGYLSMIADKILGGPGNRRWATSSFPGGQPWEPGLGHGFSVGVHDNPGGPGGGHTAGTLSAVGRFGTANVESGGSHGYVAYGGPAAGADSSQWDGVSPGRYHLGIGADGGFLSAGPGGGSSGPPPGEQSNFLKDRVKGIIGEVMDPIKGLLPQPPPEFMKIPGKVMDMTVEKAVDAAFAVVGNLGSGLRTVYEGAKNLIPGAGVVEGITSVFRDQGGFIWPGMNLVRNETGKPEAVLNWDQLERVDKFVGQVGEIWGKAGMEIINPQGIVPDLQAITDRYTLKAENASGSTQSADGMQPAPENNGGGGNDFSINIGELVAVNLNEAQKMLKDLQTRTQMRYAGRSMP